MKNKPAAVRRHEIRVMKLADLKPASYNPRTLSKESAAGLAASLDRFGLVDPLIVNKRTGYTIVGGHQRHAIMQSKGITDAQVVVVDLSEAEERALNVVLNNQYIAGEWNNDSLVTLLDQIQSDNAVDFNALRLNELLSELGQGMIAKGLTDPDSVPPVPKKPITKLGDVWILGDHRLMCGDSLKIDQVRRLIGSAKVDFLFADPPYGIDEETDRQFASRTRLAKGGKFEKIIGDKSTETASTSYILSSTLNIPVMVFWGANHYAHSVPESASWIVWDQRVDDIQRDMNSDAELAWVKCKNKSVRLFRHLWKGMIKASENREARVHPTQKPVALAIWCFTELAPESKVVLDLFGGSGSTLMACDCSDRKSLTMELSPAYCDVIIKRWEDFSAKKAKLERS